MRYHRHLDFAGNTQFALNALLGGGGFFKLLVGCLQLIVGHGEILHVAAATVQVDAEKTNDEQTHADGCPKGDALYFLLVLLQLELRLILAKLKLLCMAVETVVLKLY